MPRLAKVMLNRTVLFVSTSLEEGLLLQPNPLISLILESTLARAQTLHPVKISHHLFEPNHAHFIMTVADPNDVPAFMERFKTESAHAINRLLGRKKRTIWCEGYDSPVLLTVSRAIDRIAYIYSNPSNDGLEHSIDNYPGLSSFAAWLDQSKHTKKVPRLRRYMIPCLENLPHNNTTKIAAKLSKKATSHHELKIYPNEWLKAFGITDTDEIANANRQIMEKLRETEALNKAQREKEGRGVIGRARLVSAPMDLTYRSKRSGKRMLCHSDDIELRKQFISAVKQKKAEGREVFQMWKRGDYSRPYPVGLFPPSLPKVCEAYIPEGCLIV